MFKLKGCPRCGGDLREERDKYGAYDICLQCGFHQSDSADLSPPVLPLVSRRGRPRKVVSEPVAN